MRVNMLFFTTMLRIIVLLGIMSSTAWALYSPEGIGASGEIGSAGTYVSASASPLAIVIATLMLLLYIVLLNIPFTGQEFRVAPMWRRVAAFIVDFQVVVFAFGTMAGCLCLFLEARRTGVFHWHFERNYSVPSDSLSLPIVVLGLAALAAYFLLPLMRRSQTIGYWIFRIVTVNADGRAVRLPFSIAIRRLFAGFRGLRSASKAVKRIDEQGRTFYDVETGFTVVRY